MNRSQRRLKEKQARQANKWNRSVNLGSSIDTESTLECLPGEWRAMHIGEELKEEPPKPAIPGVDCPPVLAYHNQMVEMNMWHNRKDFDEHVAVIKQLSNEDQYEADGNTIKPGMVDWSWAYNWDCKYINLRIDMRDGGFVMTNDKGERICLEQLQWQYKSAQRRQKG